MKGEGLIGERTQCGFFELTGDDMTSWKEIVDAVDGQEARTFGGNSVAVYKECVAEITVG